MHPLIVTALYAPASRPELLPKALASGADAVIVDLEDAVLAGRKDAARANALAFLGGWAAAAAARDPHGARRLGTDSGTSAGDGAGSDTGHGHGIGDGAGHNDGPAAEGGAGHDHGAHFGTDTGHGLGSDRSHGTGAAVHVTAGRPVPLQVRVNHPRGEHGPRDLAALGAHPAVRAGRVGLRLPKTTGPDDVDLALGLLATDAPPPVYCLLESAAGIESAARIAAHPAVAGLALGEADLTAELGLRGEEAFNWIRSRIVIAAAAAGLPAPAMAVYPDLSDPQGLAESCARGRALGMFGRTALHPKQLPVIAAAFAPDPEELRRAREVVAAAAGAAADGSGAIALPDGRFVDAPMVTAAERVIALAHRLGTAGLPLPTTKWKPP